MFDILFLTFFIITAVAGFVLLRLAEGSVNKINLVTVTTIAIFLFGLLGVVPLFYGLDLYRYDAGVQSRGMLLEVFLFSSLSLLFFFIGVCGVRISGIKSFSFDYKNFKVLSFRQNLLLILIFFCSLYLLFIYINILPGIALVTVFTDGYEQAKVVRSSMGNAFDGGGAHWYKLFLYDFMTILTFTVFAVFVNSGRRLHFIVFSFCLMITVFILLMAIEKAPIVWLFVGLFFVYFIVKNNAVIPWKVIVLLSFGVVVLMVVLFQLFYGADGVFHGLVLFASRAFAGSIEPAYHYLEIYPAIVDYQYGATLPNPGGVFDFIPYRYAVEVANYVNPSLFERGIVGSMPTVFWGEAYINWGVGGVIFVSLMIGVVVALLDYILSILNVNSFTIGVYVWMVLFIKDLSVTGFSSIFINIYLYAVILLFIFMIMLRGKVQFNIVKQTV